MAKRGTKRVLEYARLAMRFANVRASRYEIRECSGGYSSTNLYPAQGTWVDVRSLVDFSPKDMRARPFPPVLEY